jgi:hypothetical protein
MAKETNKKTEEDAAAQGAAAAPPPELSNKEKYMQRYRDAYPDDDENDEDAHYQRALGNLDELDGYRKNNEALIGAMSKNKALAAMLSAAKDGEDPWLWMVKNLGADISEMTSDPEYAKKLSEAAQAYIKSKDEGKKLSEDVANNMKQSLQALKEAQEEMGISDEEAQQLASDVLDFANNVYNGIISVDDFKRFRDGGRYADDVKTAREEGNIAGRNARISEDLRKGKNPEGIPPTLPQGSNAAPKQEEKKRKSFFEGIE